MRGHGVRVGALLEPGLEGEASVQTFNTFVGPFPPWGGGKGVESQASSNDGPSAVRIQEGGKKKAPGHLPERTKIWTIPEQQIGCTQAHCLPSTPRSKNIPGDGCSPVPIKSRLPRPVGTKSAPHIGHRRGRLSLPFSHHEPSPCCAQDGRPREGSRAVFGAWLSRGRRSCEETVSVIGARRRQDGIGKSVP